MSYPTIEYPTIEYPTIDHRLWLFLPTSYTKPFDEASAELSQCGWKEEEEGINHTYLFFHINNLISNQVRNERVGRRFALNNRLRYNLQHNTTAEYQVKCARGDDFHAPFYIRKIELVLFETQISFLIFEIALKDHATIKEFTLAAYYLKKFHGEDVSICFEKKIEKDKTESVTTSLGEIATNLLQSLGVESYFQTQKGMPQQAFIFSAAILDADVHTQLRAQNELGRVIFELRRSFKKSYKPPPREFNLEGNPDVLQFFDNVYWGLSLEGATCLAFYTGDETTDNYMKSYIGTLSRSYLYILLLALHQRYALLKYNIDAAKIQKTDHGDLSKISDLQEQIAWFQLRAMFTHISSSTHYTLLYERLCAVFRIQELAKELMDEIRTLAILSRLKQDAIQVQKEKEEQRQRDEKRAREKSLEQIFIALSTLLVGVSLASDGLQSGMTDVLDYFFGERFATDHRSIISWIIFIVTLVVFFLRSRRSHSSKSKSASS